MLRVIDTLLPISPIRTYLKVRYMICNAVFAVTQPCRGTVMCRSRTNTAPNGSERIYDDEKDTISCRYNKPLRRCNVRL
jgi:hypothetical protein